MVLNVIRSSLGKETEAEKTMVELTNRIARQLNDAPITEKNRDPAGNLLAPNGIPSLLRDEMLWKWVRTPAFKEWFGDWEHPHTPTRSVVVDRNGEPMVVFHGSKGTFRPNRGIPLLSRIFRPTQGAYTWFSPSFSGATAYGGANVTLCFLKAQKALEFPWTSEPDRLEEAELKAIRTTQTAIHKEIKNKPENPSITVDGNLRLEGSVHRIGVMHPGQIMPIPTPRLSSRKVRAMMDQGMITHAGYRIGDSRRRERIIREAEDRLSLIEPHLVTRWAVAQGVAPLMEDLPVAEELYSALARHILQLSGAPNNEKEAATILSHALLDEICFSVISGKDPRLSKEDRGGISFAIMNKSDTLPVRDSQLNRWLFPPLSRKDLSPIEQYHEQRKQIYALTVLAFELFTKRVSASEL